MRYLCEILCVYITKDMKATIIYEYRKVDILNRWNWNKQNVFSLKVHSGHNPCGDTNPAVPQPRTHSTLTWPNLIISRVRGFLCSNRHFGGKQFSFWFVDSCLNIRIILVHLHNARRYNKHIKIMFSLHVVCSCTYEK